MSSPREARRFGTLEKRLEIGVATIVSMLVLAAILLIYATTHWLGPLLFTHYDNAPELASIPKVTSSRRHHSADPVNVALIGSLSELKQAMHVAGWVIADSLSRKNDIAIAKSVLLNRPDSAAPVSPLFLFGRQQDIAFERQVGRSARRRHHVRLWLAPGITHDGRQVWIGDATFDLHAGISHRGLHPTHHIAPDIDQERDTLFANLVRAHQISKTFDVTGIGMRVDAHNAEGDRYDTDGEMLVGILSPANVPVSRTDTLPDPPLVALRNDFWRSLHGGH